MFNPARAGTVLDPMGLTLRINRTVPHLVYQDDKAPCERACEEAPQASPAPKPSGALRALVPTTQP